MAHIYAAAPAFRDGQRGEGYFLHTVSRHEFTNATLRRLMQPPNMRQWICRIPRFITRSDDGVKVSCLCPQAVDTAMLGSTDGGAAGLDGILSPEQVAEAVIEGLREERFLVLAPSAGRAVSHPQQGAKLRSLDRWHAQIASEHAPTYTPDICSRAPVDKQGRFARVILNGFYAYFAEFENITLAARTRFEQAEWAIMQDFSSRRIDVYKETVIETSKIARHIAGDQIEDLSFWADTRNLYAELVRGMTNFRDSGDLLQFDF